MPKEILTQEQVARLKQSITPLQVQYSRLLEMNGPEVAEEVSRALDDNPALGIEDGQEMFDDTGNPSVFETPGNGDDDDDSSFGNDGDLFGGKSAIYETATTVGTSTLTEFLIEQLSELSLTPQQRDVARIAIGGIDSNGYLTRTVQGIADDAAIQLGIDMPVEEVKETVNKVRSLDPPGVGAVDLRDCLLLQLRRMHDSGSNLPALDNAILIIDHYFDLFAKMHLEKLASALKLSRDQLSDALQLIKTLNPKPGASFGSSRIDDVAHHITPDFTVDNDGPSVTFTINDSYPALRLEESFNISEAALTPRMRDREHDAMLFIKSKRDEAVQLINALSMRRDTLRRVMRAIIALQPDFFASGGDMRKLKPMVLRDVAAATGIDISGVSRATAGKYVATRSGSYSLKSLFNESSGSNTDTAGPLIQAAIAEIVENEPADSPLSDEAITSALATKGYNVARRTVAKYRERAGIPPARLRRRL